MVVYRYPFEIYTDPLDKTVVYVVSHVHVAYNICSFELIAHIAYVFIETALGIIALYVTRRIFNDIPPSSMTLLNYFTFEGRRPETNVTAGLRPFSFSHNFT